jgi:hypothetical protein
VYVALALVMVATVAIAVWQWDETWAHEWLPNFIAEWSGLFIAVAIVERLLARARAREEAARRQPLRTLAGAQLGRAVEGIIGTAVSEYVFGGDKDDEPPEPAATFFERWAASLADSSRARNATWLDILANSFESAREALGRVRAQYESALDPQELAHIDELSDRLSSAETALGPWAEDIDPDFERTGYRDLMPQLTPDEVARNVSNRCTEIAPHFAALASDYQALTGQQLTTERGWDNVRLTRAAIAIVGERDNADTSE